MRAWRFAPFLVVAVCWLLGGSALSAAAATTTTVKSTTVTVTVPSVTTVAATATTVPLAATTAVVITGPLAGSSVVNTALEVSGTAPADVLVAVTIVDSDTSRANVAEQPNGQVDGSVTSGADGGWVFVPQVKVVPGPFDVSASYTTAAGRLVASGSVSFVVVNGAGQSAVASSGVAWKVAVTLVILLLILAAGVLWWWHRRRGDELAEGGMAATFVAWWRDRAAAREARQQERSTRVASRRVGSSAGRHTPVGHGSSGARPSAPGSADPSPMFLNTQEGKRYQRAQAKRLTELDAAMREVEGELEDTAEALEHSHSTIGGLRRQIDDEIAEAAGEQKAERPAEPTERPVVVPDVPDDPDASKQT